MTDESDLELPSLQPSGIGEAVKNNLSPWYIKLNFQSKTPIEGRRWVEATRPLSTLQSTVGEEFEQRVYRELEQHASAVVDEWYDWGNGENEQKIEDVIRDVHAEDSSTSPVLLEQARLRGTIAAFDVFGDADVIMLFPTTDGVHAHVIDIKSSWEEKPSQQIQTAIYTTLLERITDSMDCHVTIGAGVYYRETDVSEMSITALPSFERDAREGDVQRLLRENGPFVRALTTDFDDLPLPDDDTSPYSEVFTVEAIEDGGLSILGLSPGEQQKLRQHGVESVSDVAELYQPIENPKPYEYTDPAPSPRHRDVIQAISEKTGIAERLSVISQRAQALLGELDPDHSHAHDKPWTPWVQSAGPANLPEDNPPYGAEDIDIRQNSLIRVYVNVQHDHVRDKVVAVSGRVDCGLYNESPLEFSHVVDDLVRDPESWGTFEEQLLDEAMSDMINSVQLMAGMTNQSRRAAVHFYMYTESEQEAFEEALSRHAESSSAVRSVRELFDQRAGIDQEMVSTVLPEIENRMAVKQPDHSIGSMVEYLYPNSDDDPHAEFSYTDWEMTLSSGETLNLSDAYRQQTFDSTVPIKYQDGCAEVLTRDGVSKDADEFYPLVPRTGAQIPIEYLWAAKDIDVLTTDWTDAERQVSTIERFQWADKEDKQTRLTSGMFAQLSQRFSHCLHHIERSLTYRDASVPKEELQMDSFNEFTLGDKSLADACREYLDLESFQQRSEAFDTYKIPLERRILDGESVPFRIESVEYDDDEGYFFRAHGELLYDEFGFENPQQIAGSSRVGGSDGSSSGDRCVMTEIEQQDGQYEVDASSPEQIAKSVKVSVDSIDSQSGTITVEGYRTASREHIYTEDRRGWSVESENDYQQYIGSGMEFVLDPSPGNRTAEKALRALEYAENNPVYQDFQDFKEGRASVHQSLFTESELSSYVDTVADELPFKPTGPQQDFISNPNDYVLLQGPPGTGKTSGAMANALLARLFASGEQDESLAGLVTGLSNKSVDEVLSKVSLLAERLDMKLDENPFANTHLVRLVYDKPADGGHDYIEYLDYYDDDDISQLQQLLMPKVFGGNQQTLGSDYDEDAPEHVIVFGTPGRVDGLAGKLMSGSAEAAYKNGYEFFDLLAVDEASMMPIHQLLMSSAFLKTDYQVLIGGDHRQLSPVQQYEWEDEERRTITEHLPYLSVLNYCRYLRGDSVSRLPDDAQEASGVDIPIAQLDKTYRCHDVVTEFLRKTIYEQDGINYRSDQTATLGDINASSTGLNSVMEPDAPLTVVVHDDRASRQVNRAEGTVVNACIDEIPSGESVGVVTPHNAQKGLLNTICNRGQIDTVERFQGGEKDVMFLSTTVSDPAHLSNEEEFLLSPNRLNVALSRMKKKLVVIVPATVFELVPQDVDVYDDARIWKQLYATANRRDPSWEGTIGDLVGSHGIPKSDVNMTVYNISDTL